MTYSVLIILLFTMALFIWGRFRYDIVALIALMAAVLVGAVPFKQIYTGLPNPAVVTVACVMVISQAITRSGVLNIFVSRLMPYTKIPVVHVLSLSFVSMALSAFMNNVGALALMMPIAIKTALKHRKSPAFILMPIGFASALGGLLTMIGTPPNLFISAFRESTTGHAFALFAFTPVGSVTAIIGVLFIGIVGYRLIPSHRKSMRRMTDLFSIEDYTFEVVISSESSMIDKTLNEITSKLELDLNFIAIIRNGSKRLTIPSDFKFKEDDLLILQADTDSIKEFLRRTKASLVSDKAVVDKLSSESVQLIEAVIPQGSRLDGRSMRAINLRYRYKTNLLAIAREDTTIKRRIYDITLRSGDVVLLQGPTDSLPETVQSLGLLPLIERDISFHTTFKMIAPLLIFIFAIIATALQWVPVEAAFGATVLFLVLFNLMPAKLLYEGIDWPVIIMLAAMIPIGTALQTTGGTMLIANSLIHFSHLLSPLGMLIGIMIITMTLSDFMNNAATAIVMAPIAASIATLLKVNVDPFLMAVAIASSCSFLTPIGHQNNTIVMGPGGYKFTDYIRLGLPLELLVLATSVPMLLWIWPLHY